MKMIHIVYLSNYIFLKNPFSAKVVKVIGHDSQFSFPSSLVPHPPPILLSFALKATLQIMASIKVIVLVCTVAVETSFLRDTAWYRHAPIL